VESKDLRKAGLKVTLPRVKILDILESSGTRHLSAEDIYRRLAELREDIGLATVYRVLTQFEAAGLVTRHHFADGMASREILYYCRDLRDCLSAIFRRRISSLAIDDRAAGIYNSTKYLGPADIDSDRKIA